MRISDRGKLPIFQTAIFRFDQILFRTGATLIANWESMKSTENRNDKDVRQNKMLDAPENIVQAKAKTLTPPPFQLKTAPGTSDGAEMEESQELVAQKVDSGASFADAGGGDDSNASSGGSAGGGAGLPDDLRAGIENMSGMDMSDVQVHYGSNKPAQMNALAYAQGSQIHVAPGQEKHLPHEAWHVVQQKQGRVKPTVQMKGGPKINDDAGLEGEADRMGAKAAAMGKSGGGALQKKSANGFAAAQLKANYPGGTAMQLKDDGANVQFAGTDVGILGAQAKDLAFNYMGEYWEELKAQFDLESFLLAAVGDLLKIVGIDLVKGATKAVADQVAHQEIQRCHLGA